MDYEKAYKEALKRMKCYVKDEYGCTRLRPEDIFPELAESEDERTRKALIKLVKKLGEGYENVSEGVSIQKAIAWLEKHKYTEDDLDKAYKCADEVQYRRGYEDAKKEFEKQGEHKPTEWSVSNFRTWQYIVSDVLTKKNGIGQYLDSGECKNIAKYMQEEWNKKLSVEQKPAEWAKEDIQMYHNILFYLSEPSPIKEVNGKSREQLLDWFKSLKDRYTWKPSENELEVLRIVAEKDGTCLMGLYEQLKQL